MNHKLMFKGLKRFFILWSSQTVSSLGTAITNFAIIIWVAGTIADNWDKKRIMLITDLIAAGGTVIVFILYSLSALQIWHLYVINILLSFMNAFQGPASYVATSLLVPEDQYTRVGGLQAFSNSVVNILAPALGSIFLTVGGMELVLTLDLISFAIAFLVLLFFIKIPVVERKVIECEESFIKNCMTGIYFLRDHSSLLHMILFFNVINFLAKIGNDGMISPFVLSRTNNNQNALGMVQTAVSLGILVGSLIVTLAKPSRKKTQIIFIGCAITCLGNVAQSLTHTPLAWSIAAFISYASAAIMNTNLTTIMRTHVPIEMQGRVFSAKDTLQNCTIPLGLFLGGA